MRTRAGGRNRPSEQGSVRRAVGRLMVTGTVLSVLLVAGAGQALADHVTPTPYAGDPSCSDLNAGWSEIEVEVEVIEHDWSNADDPNSPVVTIHSSNPEDQTFAWELKDASTAGGIDAVIVEGYNSPTQNIYTYDPEGEKDEGLHPMFNQQGVFNLIRISFCYDHDTEPQGEGDPDPNCDTDPTHDACEDPQDDPDPTCDEDPSQPKCNLQDEPQNDPDDPGDTPQDDPSPKDETPVGGPNDTTEVLGRDDTPTLPNTGGSILKTAAIGTALLALGLTLLAEARRRAVQA